jgi:oxygen-independent coproporphyrinogen-3 oxidase
MSFITSLTRTWLTRTTKPFTFKNEYDKILPFAECENLGLYVHIPFCKSVCNFCPYCKVKYSQELCNKYIESLIEEIHIVGRQHSERKKVTSLYFGGGTPALAANRIKDITNALTEHFIITEGIGLELHPDNVTVEVLQTLKDAGVTKISIGVQSFCDKYQKIQ